jgi:hypothetical protein
MPQSSLPVRRWPPFTLRAPLWSGLCTLPAPCTPAAEETTRPKPPSLRRRLLLCCCSSVRPPTTKRLASHTASDELQQRLRRLRLAEIRALPRGRKLKHADPISLRLKQGARAHDRGGIPGTSINLAYALITAISPRRQCAAWWHRTPSPAHRPPRRRRHLPWPTRPSTTRTPTPTTSLSAAS